MVEILGLAINGLMHPILPRLEPDAKLSDLPAQEFAVSLRALGQEVAEEFERQPEVHGVILQDGHSVIGLISREKFLEHLSRPYGLELYMKRPIKALWDAIRIEALRLPGHCGVGEAARVALARPVDTVFEPILVTSRDGPTRLLGIYVLLLAQSALLEMARDTIQDQKAAADAANMAKGQFLANMSHEIRTPMNGIVGMTELLKETMLGAEQREYLEMISVSAESLLTIINDILDFSKIEAGKLELERISFRLRDKLGDTLKPLALRAHAKELELACRVRPDVPETLLGDPHRLRQIITNLVGNAVKFTSQGEVVLRVDRHETAPHDGDVDLHFVVSDTGIGIPANRLAGIFEPFEQADGSTTRRYGGTGLGLAIVARLVELMQGRIWVESETGKGSRFHFTVRLQTETRPPALEDAPPPLPDGLRVLVVDDNATSRDILCEMLEGWRMRPVCAPSGAHAVAAANGREPFGLFIIDAGLPDTDGVRLAEQLTQQGQAADVPVVVLLAGGHPKHQVRSKQISRAAYILKPVTQSDLLNAILDLFQPATETPAEEGAPAAAAQAGRRLQVLLAEDGIVNQKLAVKLLEKWEHDVHVVPNGQDAVEAVRGKSFDVVLMDVQMPVMDGLAATAAIREMERGTSRHIPIVAMTAHAMRGDRERCLEAGMDGYLAKPIRSQELYAVLVELANAAPQPQAAPASAVTHADAPFDPETALGQLGGDEQLFREIVDVFLAEVASMRLAIASAVQGGDAPTLRRAAHTLKGSLGIVAAGPAKSAAMQLETMGANGELSAAKDTLETLCQELDRLVPVLTALAKTEDSIR